MTSQTCSFPEFVRHFQFNLFWLPDLVLNVRIREQPVFPRSVGGGHPNFAVGAGERSFHSLRLSSAVVELLIKITSAID